MYSIQAIGFHIDRTGLLGLRPHVSVVFDKSAFNEQFPLTGSIVLKLCDNIIETGHWRDYAPYGRNIYQMRLRDVLMRLPRSLLSTQYSAEIQEI